MIKINDEIWIIFLFYNVVSLSIDFHRAHKYLSLRYEWYFLKWILYFFSRLGVLLLKNTYSRNNQSKIPLETLPPKYLWGLRPEKLYKSHNQRKSGRFLWASIMHWVIYILRADRENYIDQIEKKYYYSDWIIFLEKQRKRKAF